MNMKNLKAMLISVIALFFIAGCSSEIARDVHSDINGGFTSAQVEKAIIDSGRAQLWDMKKMRDGLITGKLVMPDGSAEVRIPYAPGRYSIEYVGSQNLSKGSDRIPSKYNRWIADLNTEIQTRLNAQQALYQ